MCQVKPGPRCSSDTQREVERTTAAQIEASKQYKNNEISKEQFDEVRYRRVAARAALSLINARKQGDTIATAAFEQRKQALLEVDSLAALSAQNGLNDTPEHKALLDEYRKTYDEYLTASEVFNRKTAGLPVPEDVTYAAFERHHALDMERQFLESKIRSAISRAAVVHQKLNHKIDPETEAFPSIDRDTYRTMTKGTGRGLDLVDHNGKPRAATSA